jgi:Ser/Thr protein kinase RdoA (MazF antagonist)
VTAGNDSAVVKVVGCADGSRRWPASADPDDPYFWRREPLVYETGLLAGLRGGLRVPCLRLAAERPDGSVALWLEDVPDRGEWSAERLGEAAHRIARAQGRLVDDLPAARWLSRGWLRAYLTLRRDLIEAGGEDGQALAADAGAVLARLDRATATLCHHDLHPGNILGDGDVLVDWAYCGIAALGLDAGVLALDALFDGFVETAHADAVLAAVWEGYADGLRAEGCAVDEARWAFLAGTALRLSWMPGLLATERLDPVKRERYAALVPTLRSLAVAARELPSAS